MKKRFVKDLMIYAPSQFLPAITAFITTPILTRLLPPAEYGYWALASSISSFLVALAASGMGSAALRFYPSYAVTSTLDVFVATYVVSVTAVVTVVAALSVVVLLLLKELLPAWLVHLSPLVILIFVAQSTSAVLLAMLRAQGRSGSFTTVQLLTNYGSLGVGLLLVAGFGFRVDGLLWGTLLTLLLVFPFLLLRATRTVGINPRRFQLPDAARIWQYAWPLTLGNVAMWGLRVSDLFIIGSFWTAQQVGLYSVSYNISARSIELLVSLFLLGVSPLVYRTWETEGREATEAIVTMITRVYLLVCLPAAVGLSVLAFPLVALLTAPEYYQGARIVGFVVFSSFIWGLSNIAMMGLAIKQQARRLAANQIFAAGIHIGLQLLLVPRFGYMVSAICTLVGYIALLILQAIHSRRYLSWRFPFRTLRNAGAASVVMGAVAWYVYNISGKGSGVSLVYLSLSIAVAVPTYGVCLWWLDEIDNAEKRTAAALWDRVIAR